MFLILLFITVAALRKFAPSSSRKSIALNAFGVKRLGQSIIDTLVTPTTDSITHIQKQRPQTGDGTDDRELSQYGQDEEDNYIVLSDINRSLERNALLMGLESSSWSQVEKLERIRLAAGVDGTLPAATNFTPQTVRTASLTAGGLLEDWEF